MGLQPGGQAEKFGNRFEGRWTIKQLLRVLSEQIRAVQIEAIGDEEEGVDLWIYTRDSIREAHQCKAFNAQRGTWSLGELRKRKVLQSLQRQLAHDDGTQFFFISTILPRTLEDLTRTSRLASSFETFNKLLATGDRADDFTEFCRLSNPNDDSAVNKLIAFTLLQRTHAVQFADDRAAKDDLEFVASLLLAGAKPPAIVAALADVAESSVLQQLTGPEILRKLGEYGITSRSLGADPRTAPRLEELREDFVNSIRPSLAAGELIERSETQRLIDSLNGKEPPDAIVVTGTQGLGKSGILFEAMDRLHRAGVIIFAVRFDTTPPHCLSADEYGRKLGLAASPVLCVRDVSAGERSILILDQLDALRWTNAHAAEGLKVCKELLREVATARNLGSKIDVVFACRTSDLNKDPQIAKWLDNKEAGIRIQQIAATPLTWDVVRKTIAKHTNVSPDSLGEKERSLLASINHLAMWLEIVKSQPTAPSFQTSIQLMRVFWENRQQVLEEAGCDPNRRDETIANLARYMENNGCLSAPVRILPNDKRLVSELQSCGVVKIVANEVSFWHQAFLEFQIANTVVGKLLAQESTLPQWLGAPQEQTLFRREPLRLVLTMLHEEYPQRFIEVIRWALDANDVRFHIRQLAIELLGQCKPHSEITDFVESLLRDQRWADQVRGYVLYGNATYIKAMDERGWLLEQAVSPTEQVWQQAARMLWSVRKSAPELVYKACKHIIANRSDWLIRVNEILGHDGISSESEQLFTLKLKCLSNGVESEYVDWKQFAAKFPGRVFPLYRVLAFRDLHRDPKGKRELHRQVGLEALLEVAKTTPIVAWELLYPCLRAFHRERRRRWLARPRAERRWYWAREERVVLPQLLLALLITSGRRMVRTDYARIDRLSKAKVVSSSKWLSHVFVEVFRGAAPGVSDRVVNWLLTDKRRFSTGSGVMEPRWVPAQKLIRKMSQHCSGSEFARLENAILRYRAPEEKRLAKLWLESTRLGDFSNRFGAGQWFLLKGLSAARSSDTATGRLGVLSRKFQSYHVSNFLSRPRVTGGWVKSPLDKGNQFSRLSDSAWLDIMKSSKVTARGGRLRSGGARDSVTEASIESMSRSLQAATERAPNRFAKLYLRLPVDTPIAYRNAILWSLQSQKTPPQDVENWVPLEETLVEQILQDRFFSSDNEFCRSYCWLAAKYPAVAGHGTILQRLIDCSRNADPMGQELHIDCEKSAVDCNVSTLETNAINCVRGIAAKALSDVLHKHPQLRERIAPEIDRLLQDAHPAVQCAALDFCDTFASQDMEAAVRCLLTACTVDLRMSATHIAGWLYNYAFTTHSDMLVPLIRQMISASSDEIVEHGATQVAARWVFGDLFETELSNCLTGTAVHRRGLAKALVQIAATREDVAEKCRPLLFSLLKDSDDSVRKVVHSLPDYDGFWHLGWAPKFLETMVGTEGAMDDNHVMWRLDQLEESVVSYSETVFAIGNLVVREAGNSTGNRPYRDVTRLNTLLLRIYDRADEGTRQRCLDQWDQIMKAIPGTAWALSKSLQDSRPAD